MKRTSISIVGSGNVATHLALAFKAAGCEVRQVLSRSMDHAQLLARRVDARPLCRPEDLATDSDVYLLAVNDDALYNLALDLRLPDALVVHTSGSTPLAVLRPVSRHCGVLWSPQTFVRDIAMDYSTLPICIEGNSQPDTDTLERLALKVSPRVFHLNFDQRQRAHLAAVMVSNFVNAINAAAQEYMQGGDLDFGMLRPLAEQTLRKWDYGNLRLQQTGPAIRHDEKTLNAHRRRLASDPQLLKLYDTLTEFIQEQ